MIEVTNPIDWNHVRAVLHTQPSKYSNNKEFEALFGGFNDPLPNMKEVEADTFWHYFSMYGTGDYQGYRQVVVPDANVPQYRWNRKSLHYFIYWDGTGFAIEVTWSFKSSKSEWKPTFYSFALCEHERKSTLDTITGWHEGYCTKCGMQMNYDSSG